MITAISIAKLVITYKSCSDHKAVLRNEEDDAQTESCIPAKHCMNICLHLNVCTGRAYISPGGAHPIMNRSRTTSKHKNVDISQFQALSCCDFDTLDQLLPCPRTHAHTHIHPTKTADIKTIRKGSRNMTESPKLRPDSNASDADPEP